jgi:hypothetical protein
VVFILLVGLIAWTMTAASPVTAQTASAPVRQSEGKTVVLASILGGPNSLRISPDGTLTTTSLQIPDGYRVTAITGRWQRSADVTSGSLSIEQDQSVISVTDVAGIPATTTAFTLQLPNASTVEHAFTFGTRVRPTSSVTACSAYGQDSAVTLTDVAVVLDGDDIAPNTVANFFPQVLQKLEIVVPETPTPATAQAAFAAAATAVRVSHLNSSAISVTSVATAMEPTALSRRIVVNPAASPMLTVAGRTMTIGGDDAQMRKNTTTLDAVTLPALRQPQLSVTDAVNIQNNVKTRYSFDDLGFGNVQLQGTGRVERTLTISQAQLGGSISKWTLRLVGDYTPPQSPASGNFSVLASGTLLRSVNLDRSGHLDETVNIPADLSARDLTLTLRFDNASHEAACTNIGSFTGSIRASSSLDLVRGNGGAGGFARWPQVALPVLHVGFDSLAPTSLDTAVRAFAVLQSASPQQITVDVAAELTADVPRPLFAVSTSASTPSFLDAPLPGPGIRLVDNKSRTILALEPEIPTSTLQAFDSGGDVLLLHTPNTATSSSFVTQLAQRPNGWFDLTGDVWLTTDNHPPTALQVRGGNVRVEPVAPSLSTFYDRYRTWIIGGLVAVAILLLALIYPRLVNEKPNPPNSTPPS